MGDARKGRVSCGQLVNGEYHASHVVSIFIGSAVLRVSFSKRSPIKIEEQDFSSVGVDQQIPGCNVLMHDSQFQIEKVDGLG